MKKLRHDQDKMEYILPTLKQLNKWLPLNEELNRASDIFEKLPLKKEDDEQYWQERQDIIDLINIIIKKHNKIEQLKAQN